MGLPTVDPNLADCWGYFLNKMPATVLITGASKVVAGLCVVHYYKLLGHWSRCNYNSFAQIRGKCRRLVKNSLARTSCSGLRLTPPCGWRRVSAPTSLPAAPTNFPAARTDEAVVAHAVAQALDTFSSIDALILNAATIDPICRIGDDTPLQQWKSHFDVNFFSLVIALKAVLPALRKSQLGGMCID
jgi:NAD(P)-dependent dehydrogenase (short-subunit alcohol dehydrogenase family)